MPYMSNLEFSLSGSLTASDQGTLRIWGVIQHPQPGPTPSYFPDFDSLSLRALSHRLVLPLSLSGILGASLPSP